MDEKQKSFFERISSSDTLFIALITFMGYIAIFSYEIGYFNYFKNPCSIDKF